MTLEERISRLERSNRRLRAALVAGAVTAAALGAIAATRPLRRLRVSELDVVSHSGRTVRILPSSIELRGAAGTTEISPGAVGLKFDESTAVLSVQDGAAFFGLSGRNGYGTDIGESAYPGADGVPRFTTAASILMFSNSKKRKVIWQAPNRRGGR